MLERIDYKIQACIRFFCKVLKDFSLDWMLSGSQCDSSVKLLSRVQLFVTPRTDTCQDPLSVGFSRQEYWSGVPKQVVRRWFNVLNKGVYTGLNNPFTMCSLAHEFKLQPPVLSLSFDWISHSGSFSACYTFYPWDAALIPASVLVLDNLSSLKIRYLPTGIDLITVLIVGLLDCL